MEIITCKHGDVKIDSEDLEKIKASGWNVGTQKIGADQYLHVRMYKKIDQKCRQVSLSRFIMDAPKNKVVTFKNKDTLDLQKENLLVTTSTGKRHNSEPKKHGKSIYKGVTWGDGAWVAQITYGGKTHHISSHKDELEAAMAYDEEAIKHFEHPRLNFKEE